jgi:hypothetical protein
MDNRLLLLALSRADRSARKNSGARLDHSGQQIRFFTCTVCCGPRVESRHLQAFDN